MDSEGRKEHPLATTQNMAAFTVAALFWGLGVAMIDPRAGVGILLCLIGIASTIWLFWASLKEIRHTPIKSWPWLGLVLIFVEISIPTYLLASKAAEPDQEGATIRFSSHPPQRLPDSSYAYPIGITSAGNVPVLNRELDFFQLFSDHVLTNEEEDKEFRDKVGDSFERMLKEAHGPGGLPRDQIFTTLNPGQELIVRQPQFHASPSQQSAIMAGDLFVYNFIGLRYTDRFSIVKGIHYLAEYCVRYDAKLAGEISCALHNVVKQREAE